MSYWDNFWDTLWWVFTVTVLFAYLFILFAVISDLFRDRGLSGWAKAVWVIFLVLFPFLTVLVYLIARGRGMNERARRESQELQNSTEEYIRRVAGSSPSDEISKAKDLLDAGAITPQEFETIKGRALSAA
ncbi:MULTISPECIES: SHOCT domain-containing protein [unclassified Arthrobacter]|uniref:SHOCT domain-containing protein n=1 Tax=unclassified Arthrobacter TaxID=235627 RepID=UPI000CE407E7|nr:MULTISPECIES: SHOCT domain-containing protein [unclassified Arthrobacter]